MKLKLCLTLFVAAVLSSPSFAAEHTVEMKNVGADGSIMVFEPAVLKVAVGDTVHFVPTDPSHNSESVSGLTPEGAATWKGPLNSKVSVTLDKEGVYVYQCLPHIALAMIGVVVAGEPTNLDQIKENSGELSSRIFANKERLDNYLAEVQ